LHDEYQPGLFDVKRCRRCHVLYEPEAFARAAKHKDGKQSWCRKCKAEWEHSPEGKYKRFYAGLAPEEAVLWTWDIYLSLWEKHGGCCEWCGAGLTEWQSSGYNIDRISNSRGYLPGNAQLLCKPCNFTKSDKNPIVAKQESDRWVAEFGRGRVQWNEVSPRWKPAAPIPDLSNLEVAEKDDEEPFQDEMSFEATHD